MSALSNLLRLFRLSGAIVFLSPMPLLMIRIMTIVTIIRRVAHKKGATTRPYICRRDVGMREKESRKFKDRDVENDSDASEKQMRGRR